MVVGLIAGLIGLALGVFGVFGFSLSERSRRHTVDIVEPTSRTVDELKKLNLPAGVDITIKI